MARAWRGAARLGRARQGKAGRGTRLGRAGHGVAWQGGARRGKARIMGATPVLDGRRKVKQGFLTREKLMRKDGVFFGGVPTDIDIRTLREAFPESKMAPGVKISYDKVAELLDVESRSYRFRTVTHRWRRLVEKDTGIVIGAGNGTFVVMDDHEKLDLSVSKLRASYRSVRRSVTVAGLTDRKVLTTEEQKKYDALTAKQKAMLAAAQVRGAQKELPSLT
jgi:hypothetical protein